MLGLGVVGLALAQPNITSISPTAADQNQGGFTLTITGTGIATGTVPNPTVRFVTAGGTTVDAIGGAFVGGSGAFVVTTVPNSALDTVGITLVSVQNAGGPFSN